MSDSFSAARFLRDKPRISYVEPEDPWLTRKLVSSLEVAFGRKRIEAIYHELKARPFCIENFFNDALERANISLAFDETQLAKVPDTGPLVFVANHPFGVVDGIILCELAIRARGNFRILLNALLCQDRDLAEHFLPIDFAETKAATKTNIESKRRARSSLQRDVPVLIFPSGMVSTACRFGLGDVNEGPWSTFAAKLIRDCRATVIPVHFHGYNSRKFHIASHVALPLRMALLVNEALNKFNQCVSLDIGDPITWEDMAHLDGRQALTDFLFQRVMSMGQSQGKLAAI